MWRRGQYYIFIEKSELLKIDRYGIGVNIYLFLFCDLSYYDNHFVRIDKINHFMTVMSTTFFHFLGTRFRAH